MDSLTLTSFYNWTCFASSPQNKEKSLICRHYETLSRPQSEGLLPCVYIFYFYFVERFEARLITDPLFQGLTKHQLLKTTSQASISSLLTSLSTSRHHLTPFILETPKLEVLAIHSGAPTRFKISPHFCSTGHLQWVQHLAPPGCS